MRAIGVVAATLLLGAVTGAKTAKPGLLRRAELISREKAFTPEKLKKALDLPLSFTKVRENEHFIVYEADVPKGAAVTGVELRSAKNGKGGLVILNVAKDVSLTLGVVLKRYGLGAAVYPPSPHLKVEGPTFYVYPRDGGELRFGVTRGEPRLLTDIVIDSMPL